MKPKIPPHYYSDPDIFERERRTILNHSWSFAGTIDELPNHEDFITLQIGDYSVVVYNFEGELKAFHNVCSHRFATIKNEVCGNGKLQCPYHGWIYDSNGMPYAIPKRPKFPEMNPELQCALSLEKYELETCGNFIFVRKANSSPNLKSYLGPLYRILEEMSYGIGPRIDRNILNIKSNWKICVENTLESYHVGFVHHDTFKRLGLTDEGFEFYPPHSTWTGSVEESMRLKFEKFSSIYESRKYQIPGYLHILVFPTTTIATTYGSSFSIQEFYGVSPDETRFTSHVYGCKLPDLTGRNAALVQAMNESIVQFNRSVFEEDRVVTEYAHNGSKQTHQTGILSDEEERVCEFQKAYINMLETDSSSNSYQSLKL